MQPTVSHPQPTSHPWRRGLVLLASLALSFGAASLGALFIPGEWYASLAKPSWNPPGWVFGPVWTTLYMLMAVAAWLVWQRSEGGVRRRALGLYLGQLMLNAAWTPLFFGLHLLGAALVEMLLLWVAIAATMVAFHRVHRLAAWLLAPYLAWVSFAAFLNFTLWRLNA